MRNLKKKVVTAVLLVVPTLFAFAGGAQEAQAPQLDIPAQPRQYISPANEDGVQDVLQLPFSSVVVPGEEMVIVEYALTVYDADGRLVYAVSEAQDERRGFFGNLFGGEKPRVEVPDTLTWNGTWSVPEDQLPDGVADGDLVEDGEYTYQLTVSDDAGQSARSAPFNVTVDNTAPAITSFGEPEYTVFSPNDDGVRDSIAVGLEGTRELSWTVDVIDADGDAVYTEEYRNDAPRRRDLDPAPPAMFEWTGVTGTAAEPGDRAPEGSYRIRLTGVDRSGNETVETHPTSITLSLRAADLTVTAAESPAVFSPNDDGVRDDITLLLSASDPEAIRTWSLEVVNRNQVVRRRSGSGTPPAEWVFDGRRDDGSVLNDGTVQVRLRARLDNGNDVESAPFSVTLDTVAPQVSISAATVPEPTDAGQPLVFGAGDKNALRGTIEYDAGVPWTYELSIDGRRIAAGALREFLQSIGATPETVGGGSRERVELRWNGTAVLGNGEAMDGTYRLVLSGTDSAGNSTTSAPARVVKDSRTPAVDLTVDGEYLSPLSGGAFGTVVYRTDYGAPELVQEFLFEVRNADDRMVRSSYQRQGFGRFEWNGLTNGGTVVPDGPYTAQLRVIYQNGHEASVADVGPVIVDRTRPRVNRLAAEPRRFSPDGDGDNDTVTIVQEVEPGDSWEAQLVNESGDVVIERAWGESVETFTWDGTGPDGEPVPDGDYRYVLSATDNAGNSTTEDILVTVDTEPAGPPEVTLSVRPQPFSPDDDGRDDTLTIEIRAESDNRIVGWMAQIVNPDGGVFRTFSGEGTPPRRIRWNGTSDDGELVETAREYPLEVTVRDHAGQQTTATETIAVDILVFRDGDRLRIRVSNILFAPNTPDLFLSDEAQLDENLDTLRRLATILNRYPDRDIVIEGHAAHIYLDGAAKDREQEQVLIPLSRSRAREVMQALMILGVDRERMTIEAYGGARPVVPHSDRDSMWRNRRVEFLLQRPGN